MKMKSINRLKIPTHTRNRLVWYIVAVILVCSVLPRPCDAELKAGTAKTVITPANPIGMKLTIGKLNDGTMLDCDKVLHDIYARVLVLDDGVKRIVIVTHDSNSIEVATPILRERCRDELGIDPSCFIPISTHNHQAPMPRWKANFPYQRWVAERIFAAIKEAIANERGPARVFFGQDYGYFIKSVGNAPVDYEIQLLKVTCNNDVVALLFNQPTHVIQSSTTRTELGVGHPGYALDELEKRLPGTIALYGDACGGNQFPIPPAGDMSELEKARTLGRTLADIVQKISGGELQEVTGPLSSTMEVVSLPLAPPVPYEKALELARDIPLDIGYDHAKDRGTNWIRAVLKHYREGIPFPVRTTDLVCADEGYVTTKLDTSRAFPCRFEEAIVAKIGPMPFVALQGEVCAPIGMRIKDAFRSTAPIMLFAYMGEQNLYIPTRELVRLDAYQSQVIRIQYASPCGWAPEVEDEMVDGVVKIVKSVLGD